jgi:hypothetical protein
MQKVNARRVLTGTRCKSFERDAKEVNERRAPAHCHIAHGIIARCDFGMKSQCALPSPQKVASRIDFACQRAMQKSMRLAH